MPTEHPHPPTKKTQCDLILAELRRRAGRWVPMPELWQCSGSFVPSVRISDLRRRGWKIENKVTRRGRTIHSFFKLLRK